MSLGSWVVARWAGLPPAHTYKVGVERDLRIPMPDGVGLLADRYFSRDDEKPPIILLRSPYGRRQVAGTLGRIFAERGFQSVVQSTRGTFGSGGEFEPFRHEAADGRATLDWLAAQPWFGGSVAMVGGSCDAHLNGDRARLPKSPVRLFVMGANRWTDLQDWPPPARPVRWYLQPAGGLATDPPPQSEPDPYDYDPANPTPSVGGPVFGRHAGPRDNRKLEARPDVLTYTSAPLEHDLEVIGPVAADLYVRSSLQHTDFFARLCDVGPGGRSVNVCDGLVRLWPMRFGQGADGTTRIRIDLWSTAYSFGKGHRLRLQVSSGAHPRFSRNLGGGEPLATAATFTTAHQSVFHDRAHPSGVYLPEWADGFR